MNIIVPMAGRGARFAKSGVDVPKPLISVNGRPMFAWALESLGDLWSEARIVIVVLKEHESRYGISSLLRSVIGSSAQIVVLDDVTEGQLCTVLAATDHIDRDKDLLVASCDTYVVSDLAKDI
ncbi:MAG: NTP transferase domain-containing protein, partial [Acidobacteriota bacterium]|nr:NTP transferase domain-containing protein [Acidobacteriota bacterium]